MADRSALPADGFLLGAAELRTRQPPIPVGLLLCTARILFPLSRASRIEWVAHLVDALLVVAFAIAALTADPLARGRGQSLR